MKRFSKLFSVFILTLFFFNVKVFAQTDTLTQISTIDALLIGIYDGEMTIGELKQYGDFGLGTFNGLDGEMLVLDGRFYQITSDGVVRQPDINTKTPFAAITYFETDQKFILQPDTTFRSFEKQMDSLIPTPNIFYAIRIEGVFRKVKTKSVPRQKKPYRSLKEIAKDQPTFDFKDIEGTIVGFRCPDYMKGINVPGYHLHFLTRDGKAGGHVLEFTVQKAVAKIDQTSKFFLILPDDREFYGADLSKDKQADLKQVEK
ncbi:Alpha-acetolactate decarboxylase [hydrothermal vent metagenome]|uniref:Alpha-acetolactate decarboxylase n=1 Tax=hydrothermal vent metagenome TaxID=652676 RepID=A0A3B1D197_9ZZZZ